MSEVTPSIIAASSFTRPANTTAYAAGDLVANNTTAGSVVPLSWSFAASGSRGVFIRRVQITKGAGALTNASFRLWLLGASPVVANGDNGALSIASGAVLADLLGFVAVTVDATLTGICDTGVATMDRGLIFAPTTVYGLLEARAAYTPLSAESFAVTIRAEGV